MRFNEMNNFVSLSRRGVVRLKYTWSELTGHRVLFVGKEGKKKTLLTSLDVIAWQGS